MNLETQPLWKILNKKLSDKEIKYKFESLYNYASKCFSQNSHYAFDWFQDVVHKIDQLWYSNLLLVNLKNAYTVGLVLEIDEKHEDQRVAGFVREVGSKIVLSMNKYLFQALFHSNENGYHSGGVLCKNAMICFLHVLLHETVHLILTMYDKLGLRKDHRDHGKEFNRFIKNLFGQTDSQHGLIDGYEQYDDLDTIKKQVKKNMPVEIFVNGHWVKAVVLKKGYKWVYAKVDDDEYRIHIGLVRLINTTL